MINNVRLRKNLLLVYVLFANYNKKGLQILGEFIAELFEVTDFKIYT